MSLWDIKTALRKDIKTRGATYEETSSTGRMIWKSNPAVKEIVNVNRQMLSLLKELGLTTENTGGDDEDEL
jgi:phage terminase small subunit